MTNRTYIFLTGFVLLTTLFSISSCVNSIDDDDDDDADASVSSLHITTRGATGGADLSYPITLYAFDSGTSQLAAKITLQNTDDNSTLVLPTGNYHLVALCGTGECTLPEDAITPQSAITLPANGYTTQAALQMGSADVTVNAGDAAAEINLTYRMARIDLALTGLPKETTGASVSLSALHGTMNLSGTYGEAGKTVTVACQKQENGSWKVPAIYTLPGSGSNLTLSIALTKAGGSGNETTTTYGYTSTKMLQVGTPYLLTGSYKEGFSINGSFTAEGWKASENIGFNFGENNGESSGDSGSGDAGDGSGSGGNSGSDNEANADGSYNVTAVPAVRSLWNGHFVVAVQNAKVTGADLLLLSLKEWKDVASANYSENVSRQTEASEFVAAYTEGKMTGWGIPTDDERKLIQKACGGSSLTAANNLLTAAGGDALTGDGKDSHKVAVRYLFNEAESSYNLVSTSGGSSQGGTTRTYYLRAVKTVKVVVK